MATKRRTISHQAPLIVEPHPDDYSGYPFITLIQYNKEHLLTVVDNSNDDVVNAYVLDLCGPEEVDEQTIVEAVNDWYHTRKDRYPLSFEFSIRGMSGMTSKIYKSFNTDFITRVIGPLPTFNMEPLKNVRRRKRKELPINVPVVSKANVNRPLES